MEQQKEPAEQRRAGASCPECGTPRAADHTPSCACGPRAADALRDTRTAQAAAAEDFDPLRIRPYVELEGTEGPPGPPATADAAATDAPTPDPDATMTLRTVDAGTDTGPAAGTAPETGTGPEAGTGPGAGTGPERPLPTPLAPSAGSPSAHDLRLFETSATAPLAPVTARTDETAGVTGSGTGGGAGRGRATPRKRRRGVLLSAAGAVVVVVGAAGFASGLFSYETPSRDGAMPDEVRAGVPDPSSTETSPSAEPTAPSTAPPSVSASPDGSVSASASTRSSVAPSPSVSASSASSAPSGSAEPTPTATAGPTEQATQESGDDDRDFYAGPELRRGDQGPEVVELQQRLKKAFVYTGDTDGHYDRRVEESVRTYQSWRGIHSDEKGVYGPDTRHRLESETGDL
ncbi:peptidoglycan-binding domain-containing protein [Streptomyces mayonensis]|uniref:peptidoglycan-binding domain-containing protein n=1 Tax=Streptomyces mayonensis TaxID=2750816 RepID=UPI001C1E0C28|nr:peptidoglycan-binding domain-containing protein [Streptomyces sp. A108]MBU6534732.1 peptidoglycan-binding protein [Streptomyces sp. A108]